ncbi:MAG TPA: hypothetical protein VMV23_08980 [Candidatus Nanopelagicaceae bacterium]|nr:hypothetical protein [Candidatus Nanopelagicaceae bacterium]
MTSSSAPAPGAQLPPTARLQLQVIDMCLDHLEEMHLEGTHITRQRGCQQVVDRLATALRSTPPEPVLRARNSYALHAALLNWQATVMDGLVPDRRQRFPDLADEEWTVPRLSKLRSQRSMRESAPVASAQADPGTSRVGKRRPVPEPRMSGREAGSARSLATAAG